MNVKSQNFVVLVAASPCIGGIAVPAHASVLPESEDGSLSRPVSTTGTELTPDSDSAETRVAPFLAIIAAVIAAGGTAHAMGTEAAKRSYYAGLRNTEYQSIKWNVRAFAVGLIGPVLGITFMVGFENQFYLMV